MNYSHPKEDPVQRLSVIHNGVSFKLNGIEFENQLNDIARDNQNYNFNGKYGAPLNRRVREFQVEGGGLVRFIKDSPGGCEVARVTEEASESMNTMVQNDQE